VSGRFTINGGPGVAGWNVVAEAPDKMALVETLRGILLWLDPPPPPAPRKEPRERRRIPDAEAWEMAKKVWGGATQRVVAREHGISRPFVNAVARGRQRPEIYARGVREGLVQP
jgi:hypothetical protein